MWVSTKICVMKVHISYIYKPIFVLRKGGAKKGAFLRCVEMIVTFGIESWYLCGKGDGPKRRAELGGPMGGGPKGGEGWLLTLIALSIVSLTTAADF